VDVRHAGHGQWSRRRDSHYNNVSEEGWCFTKENRGTTRYASQKRYIEVSLDYFSHGLNLTDDRQVGHQINSTLYIYTMLSDGQPGAWASFLTPPVQVIESEMPKRTSS
jgi:hypothetical protein